jgi:hypothetical protein
MASDEEPVGYRRPPKHSQFKPGQSGNPRGRKPGAKGAAQILAGILNEKVFVVVNGRRRSITMLEAVTKQLVNKAGSGDAQASKQLFSLITGYGEQLFDNGTRLNEADSAAMEHMVARIIRLRGGDL